MNELHKRGYVGVGSDIIFTYNGIQEGSAFCGMEYIPMNITNADMV